MNRYTELSTAEKLALNAAEFAEAVKLEAIERRVPLPVTMDNALKQGMFTAYTIPADAVTFYEIVSPGRYGGTESTGVAFRTEEEARAILKNVFCIVKESYPDRLKIVSGEFGIQARSIVIEPSKTYSAMPKIEESDNSAFEAVMEECANDLSEVKAASWNRERLLRKKAEYLALAKDDESIARAFWLKGEGTEWPTESATL